MRPGGIDWDKPLYKNRKGRRKHKKNRNTYKAKLRNQLKPIKKEEER